MAITIKRDWEGQAPRRTAFTFVGRAGGKVRKGHVPHIRYMITGFPYAEAERKVVAHMRNSIGTRDMTITAHAGVGPYVGI